MTHRTIIKVVRMISLLAALGLQAACASDGGSAAGTGGAPGTGGALGGGSGGTAGVEPIIGGGTPRPCTAAETIVAPADGMMADFTDPNVGIGFAGGHILAYPIGSTSAPTYTTTGGSLHITLDRSATSVPQYLGVIVGADKNCIDATAFSGVQFSISGSFSGGCTMRYYANDDVHQDDTTGAPHASGPAGSYPPETLIPARQVTSTAQTLRMPFTGQSGGSPATPVDRARLIFVGWQFDVDATTSSTPGSCVADLTIDDVRFYAEGASEVGRTE